MTMLYSAEGDKETRSVLQKGDHIAYRTFGPHNSPTQRKSSSFIEPIIFLCLMARSLGEIIIPNVLEYHTCRYELGLLEDNCTEPVHHAVEDLIQPTTSQVIMVRALVEAAGTAVLTLFVGPWSDANGRRSFLIASLAGMTATYVCWGCLALLPGLLPQYFLLASIPLPLTGGPCTLLMLCFSYICDVTDEQFRPLRLSMVVFAVQCSGVFGTIFGPILMYVQYPLNPYPLVFFLSASLMLATTIYTYYFIEESVEINQNREIRLFKLSYLKSCSQACFKQRKGGGRVMILVIIATIAFNYFVTQGENGVIYLSTRELFSWQLGDFTLYSCFSSLLYGFGGLFGVWLFSSFLQLPNIPVASAALLTRCARSTVMALSSKGIHFYLSTIVSVFFPVYDPLIRSELSQLVTKDDSGKIFALAAFIEHISPLCMTPVYTYLYQSTFLYNPAAVYWLSTALSTLCVLMFVTFSIAARE